MLWLQPAAWLGLVALAVPLLIHLLVHRRSERLAFPTLRFLQPTRLASLRRHRLDDRLLLLLRAAILAAAVAALAGPLLVTPARQASWNRRVARAIVIDPGEPGRGERTVLAQREAAGVYRSTIIEESDPAAGMRRAAAWLAEAPPARREIVVVAPFALGTVTAADVAAVPPEIGLRFVRNGTLPQTRTIPGAPLLAWADAPVGPGDRRGDLSVHAMTLRDRTVVLSGGRTSVRDADHASRVTLPLDIVAPADAAAVVDAALRAVVQQGVPAPAAGRTARLVIAGAPGAARIRASAVAIHTPWIGDAVARLAEDRDVARTAGAIAALDAGLPRAPWQSVASGADGAAVVSAAQAGDQLIVTSRAAPSEFLTPVLIRSMLDTLAVRFDPRAAEVVPIADAQLRAWERTAGPARMPRPRAPGNETEDDRRWMWVAALGLIALEGWTRGRGQQSSERERREVADRVA